MEDPTDLILVVPTPLLTRFEELHPYELCASHVHAELLITLPQPKEPRRQYSVSPVVGLRKGGGIEMLLKMRVRQQNYEAECWTGGFWRMSEDVRGMRMLEGLDLRFVARVKQCNELILIRM